jgi:hypothetical protein
MYVLPFDIPGLMNNIGDRQKNQALWVDVYVPRDARDAPPGTYTAAIKISSDAGSEEVVAAARRLGLCPP